MNEKVIIPDPPPPKGDVYGCDWCVHLGCDKHGNIICTKHGFRKFGTAPGVMVGMWTTRMWEAGECEDLQTSIVTKLCRLVGKRKNRGPGWRYSQYPGFHWDPSWEHESERGETDHDAAKP